MVGPSNASNRFGPSSYVVGTSANGLGNGVNFTSIQAAVNQAVADGHGVLNPADIIIRPGVYVEDVTIANGGINLAGSSSSFFNILGMPTIIQGTLTLTISAVNSFYLSNIMFDGITGPALSVSGAGIPLRISANNCVFRTTGGGFPAISLTNNAGTFGFANFTSCVVSGDAEGYLCTGRTLTTFFLSNLQGQTNAATLNGTARIALLESFVNAAGGFGVQFLNSANQVTRCEFSHITSSDAAVDMTVGGVSNISNTNVSSSAASGFWVTGIGNLEYCDIVNSGSAIAIDPGLSIVTVNDWKPYAEAGASPGTGVVKGTACFDSSQFSVVDGFVQFTGSVSFPWVEQNASVTVNANQGNFSVANITLTLPAAPAMGDTCKFKVVTNDTLVIAGQVGDVLQLGNQAGTTITSTSSGDAIELTHYDLGIWIANASVGNWVVA
jgi:hypothetical protein